MNLREMEDAARCVVGKMSWDYWASGAGDFLSEMSESRRLTSEDPFVWGKFRSLLLQPRNRVYVMA